MLMDEDKKLLEVLEELSLVLMYITRFREDKEELWRAWKGYEFSVLAKLQEKDFISFSYKAKSVSLKDEGITKAKQLLKKYGVEIDDT